MTKISKKDEKGFAALGKKLSEKHSGEILLAKSVSFRVPVDLLAWLDVIAERAGESRTSVLNDMVQASVEETLKSIDDGTRKMLETKQIELLHDIVQKYKEGNLGDLFSQED